MGILWDIFVFPFRVLTLLVCAALLAIVMPFLLVGRLFGVIEPAHLPS
jgi:hypothetical protein